MSALGATRRATMEKRHGGRRAAAATAALVLLSTASTASVSAFAPSTVSNHPAAFGAVTSSSTPAASTTTALSMARRGRPRGPVRTIEVKPPMNEEITQRQLRVTVLSDTGTKDETLGVMSRDEALAKAKELGNLDLILINENSDPPVCKIADYSKYRYRKERAAKEKKKNAKSSDLKEVKMSYKIDKHDYDVRKKAATKFLGQGNRVKATVMFRGREVQHDNLGVELLNQLAEDLEKECTMEGRPKREGRNLSCFLTPRPELLKKINDEKRKAERDKKKVKEEKRKLLMEKQAAAAAAAAGGVASVAVAAVEEEDVPISMADLDLTEEDDEEDVDVTLDDLLGGDDLTDDLFS